MAITYTKEDPADLVLISQFRLLMQTATGQGSAYLKAKETLAELLINGTISAPERAQIVSQMLVGITNNITNQSMDIAYKFAQDRRDAPYLLTKMREDTKLVSAQILLAEKEDLKAEVERKVLTYTGWKLQGDLVKDYGINAALLNESVTLMPAVNHTDAGTKAENTKLVKANKYNTYASSFRANGYVSIPLNTDGTLTNGVVGDERGLSVAQTAVAVRQKEGFDDNMRQHVANSMSTMVSMLLSTEASGIDYVPYLDRIASSADYLNTTKLATAGSLAISVAGVLTAGVNYVISGTSTNIAAGAGVSVYFTTDDVGASTLQNNVFGGADVVQTNDTWSITATSTALLVGATYTVTVKVLDSTGNTRVAFTSKVVA